MAITPVSSLGWEDTNPSMRLVIQGSPESVSKARAFVDEIVKDIRGGLEVIYYPSIILGTLIGKGGAVVRGFEAAFQVRIHIENEGPPLLFVYFLVVIFVTFLLFSFL